MFEHLQTLCMLDGPSGREEAIRAYIIEQIKDYCDYSVDALGNILAFKKGKQSGKKVLFDAHMDEVGFIVTAIGADGLLSFSTVGGITTDVLMAQRVRIGHVVGVVSVKPVHLLSDDQRKSMPKVDELVIDIGAKDKEDAERLVRIGDMGTFDSDYVNFGNDCIKAKALDDRIGCALLISLIQRDLPYDASFSFSVQEEVGLRGAKVSSYTVAPDYAIVLEATTASDIPDTPVHKQVCKLGEGVAVSFMDNATLYEKRLFDCALQTAKDESIPVQVKTAVAGGNNAGAIHLSRGGVPTLTLSVPCRYIHSANSIIAKDDVESALQLALAMLENMAGDRV